MATLNHLSAAALAQYQQSQGQSNNCALYTLTTLLNIRFGLDMHGADLAKSIDEHWAEKPFYYRVAPNWATLPGQSRRVIHKLAQERQFQVRTELGCFSDAYLRDILAYNPNTYPVMTFFWVGNGPKLISHQGSRPIEMHANGRIGGHTMLLAAYDAGHTDQAGLVYPWGFINSWATGDVTDIFWMDEATWRRLVHLKTLLVRIY